jgi:hypothetical protein
MIVIAAPSNLGLRPLRPGHEPGAWRAPAALFAAGMLEAVGAFGPVVMARPAWKPGADPGTRLRNGLAMRDFNLELAGQVAPVCARRIRTRDDPVRPRARPALRRHDGHRVRSRPRSGRTPCALAGRSAGQVAVPPAGAGHIS